MISPKTSMKPAMLPKVPLATISSLAMTEVEGEGGLHNPSRIAQPSTVPTGPVAVAHTSHELVSAADASIGSIMMPEVSSAMVSSITVSEATGANGLGGPRSQNQSSTLPVKPVGVA